jgi:CRP-like cAMP-binding protein
MVQVTGLEKILREHPFFKDMDEASIKTLSGCAKNERFDRGAFVAHEGDRADKFYLIRSGTVALEFDVPGRGPIVIETLHTGEILGWSWVLPPYKWSCDLRATEMSRLLSLDVSCLRDKLDQDHSLGYDLYSRFSKIMARRLHAAHLQLSDMFGSGS